MYCMGFLTFAGLSVRSFVCVCLSVCLFVCLSLNVCMFFCLLVCRSVCPLVCLFVFLLGCLSFSLCASVLFVCACDGHFVCLCVIVMVMSFPPQPQTSLSPKGWSYRSEVWGCACFLDVPQPGNRIRFVRACGRGEAACLRERDSVSVAGLKIPEFLSGSGSFALIEHSFLHGIFEFCSMLTDMCMGSMPSRNCVKLWYGLCRILYDLLIYCMGFYEY